MKYITSGESHGKHHAHESPLVMTAPLMILALGSMVMGIPGSPLMHHWLQGFLEGHAEEIHMNSFVVSLSIATSIIGFVTAFIFYLVNKNIPKRLAEKYWIFYTASQNKLWFDELYQATFICWFKGLANTAFKFDATVIDGLVNQVGLKTVSVSKIKNWIDQNIVDGLVNFTGWITRSLSALLRKTQTGFIYHYLFFVLLGILIIVYTES